MAEWLAAHPGVEIVTRDRAKAYAEAARLGAPQARQVVDRWHVWNHLTEAVEKVVGAHHGCVKTAYADLRGNRGEPGTPPEPPDGHLDVNGRESALVARTTARYAAVQELAAQGRSLKGISRELNLDYEAVRRYARAGSLDELLVAATHRTTVLDAYKPYLYRRYAAGCHNACRLFREIQTQGYTGSASPVDRYIRQLRKDTIPPPPPRPVPKPRAITAWIMTHPDHLSPDDAVISTRPARRAPSWTPPTVTPAVSPS